MNNKLKLGQAAGVVAFAIIIGAVSMSSSSTVDARTSLKENHSALAMPLKKKKKKKKKYSFFFI